MQGYILFTSPALFLMTSEFWLMLSDYKKVHKYKWFFSLILISLIFLPVRYMIERTKPFEIRERKPVWISEIKKLNDRKVEKGVLFNFQYPVRAMFYTDFTVYPNVPSQSVINDLINKGYTIFIKNDGKLPEYIKNITGVNIDNNIP